MSIQQDIRENELSLFVSQVANWVDPLDVRCYFFTEFELRAAFYEMARHGLCEYFTANHSVRQGIEEIVSALAKNRYERNPITDPYLLTPTLESRMRKYSVQLPVIFKAPVTRANIVDLAGKVLFVAHEQSSHDISSLAILFRNWFAAQNTSFTFYCGS